MTPLIIICCYLALLLGLGVFSSRLFKGTSSDYMVASHSIGPFLLLMSLFGTTMTAFALVGSTGEAFRDGIGVYGMLASSSGIIHSLCFFLLGVKLWSWGKRFGYRTQIQFFRDRLDSDKIGLLLFPILVSLVIPYLLIGVMASGDVINGVTKGTFEAGTFPAFMETTSGGGVPSQIASAVICAVVLIYVFFGGMRGTAWANTFQTIVFMVLGIVTFFLIASKIGGGDSLMESMRSASEKVPDSHSTRVGMSKLQFGTYLLIPLSVGMFPHLFQHWLTAKNASSFKLSVVAHPVFIMIVWVPCVLIGVWAVDFAATSFPPPLQAAVGANSNKILPILVNRLTGAVLGGFLSAGVLAAIMSSLDSQFLSIGTMFTEDLVVHYRGRDKVSDKSQVLLARVFIILVVVITYYLSLFEPRSVFRLGVWSFSGFSSLFPLIFAAVYWTRLTKAGAYASILAAFSSWLFLFWQSDWGGKDESYTIDFTIGGETYSMMPVVGMFAASTFALVVVSLLTEPPKAKTLRKFFPKKVLLGSEDLDESQPVPQAT